MVIPTFIQQALVGKDITVYGHGFQTRSFCYVRDVVSALFDLMNCENAIGRVVNIGSNEEISIAHLAEKIKELTGTSSKIINIPYEKAYTEGFEDLARRVPNINLAKELIGFKPQWNLNETLKSILDGCEWKTS
jgi:UDP-glucose 4-epimerase